MNYQEAKKLIEEIGLPYEVEISCLEAAKEYKGEFDDDYCSACDGSGEGSHDGSRCENCKGSGVDAEQENDDYDFQEAA